MLLIITREFTSNWRKFKPPRYPFLNTVLDFSILWGILSVSFRIRCSWLHKVSHPYRFHFLVISDNKMQNEKKARRHISVPRTSCFPLERRIRMEILSVHIVWYFCPFSSIALTFPPSLQCPLLVFVFRIRFGLRCGKCKILFATCRFRGK